MNFQETMTSQFFEMKELDRICYFFADIKEGAIKSISSNIEEITGYRQEDFLEGESHFYNKLFLPKDLNRLKISRRLIMFYGRKKMHTGLTAVSDECHIRHASGSVRKVKITIKILQYDAYGFPTHVIGEILSLERTSKSDLPGMDPAISKREQEVLHLLAQGFSSKEIADKLYISDHTSMTHRKNLIAKYNVRNTAELIKEASKRYSFQ